MRTRNLVGTKEHYKAYKAGKRWLYACITVATVGLGLVGGTGLSAQADTAATGEEPTAIVAEPTTASVKDDSNVEPVNKDAINPGDASQDNDELKDDPSDNAGVVKDDAVNEDTQPKEETLTPGNAGEKEPDPVDQQQEQENNTPSENENVSGNKDKQQSQDVVNDQNNQNNVETDKAVQTPNTPPVDPVAPAVNTSSRRPMMRAAMAVSSGPKTLVAVPVYRAPDFDNILGKDAAEWMPDANLRALVIGSIDKQYYGGNHKVTSANLYQYAGFDGWMTYGVNTMQEYFDLGPIKSLEGLQYFTNLRTFKLSDAELPLAGMIDFSFAPNLREFTLFNADGVVTDWGVAPDTILHSYFATNDQLQYLTLSGLNLNGSFPDLTAYPELYMLSLDNNQLTGNLPDISYLKNLFSLSVNDNQLSGQLPDMANWSITTLRITKNKFSGKLPSTATLTAIEYGTNQITTAIAPGSYRPGAFVVGNGQTLDNGHHVLTNANNRFDPTEGLFDFMDFTTGEPVTDIKLAPGQFNTGATIVYSADSTAGITNHNAWAQTQTDASNWFTIVANPANPYGFLLVAKPEAKDGNYVIRVKMADGTSRDLDAWVNFSVVNKMTTGTVTPETPEPGVTTGTVTIVSVDQDGKVIAQQVKTGNVGDTYSFDAPEITGYQATGVTHAQGIYTADGQTVTFTYNQLENAGDADKIDDTTPTTKDTTKQVDVTTGGAADTIATDQTQPAGRTNRVTGPAQGQVTGVKNQKTTSQPAATKLATGHSAATTAAKTSLPQTNEASTGNYILAGVATLLGALGLASLRLRKH
ncbi:MucBP domain-containing protein [Levilactobacillus suantsaiihabitans]|uniref:MucBP domain-containing protein n=1 Tax=Levilactobacillus suantsaiihabitans TaxID=2487722 RepID=UPI0015CFF3D8|nr:MucBP domain-containing protein [Levilactobacillus suantsaiihabitans]